MLESSPVAVALRVSVSVTVTVPFKVELKKPQPSVGVGVAVAEGKLQEQKVEAMEKGPLERLLRRLWGIESVNGCVQTGEVECGVCVPLYFLVFVVSAVAAAVTLCLTTALVAPPEAQRVRCRCRGDGALACAAAVVGAVKHFVEAVLGGVRAAYQRDVGGLGVGCACFVLSECDVAKADEAEKDCGCGTHSE